VPYRSKAAFPYTDTAGNPFDDRDFAMRDTFPAVDESSFPYRPVFRTEADRTVKVPDWLNDPLMYHNRGTSTFAGEDAEYGDFPSGNRSALDDLWTERPEVVNGMIDIYRTWVEDAGVDGFRIDTVKHVNLEFWKRFGPALQGHAASIGNDDFFMFGEVYDADPRVMSTYTTAGRLQATVDFGFQGTGVNFAKGRPTSEVRDFYASDDWYTDADSNAYSAPTFLGNHDMGRVGMFLKQGTGYDDAGLLRRDQLAHSLMYLTRGQPVVYYGDEQGFTGDGGDQDARENMFASSVATYNDNDLIGTSATTATSNFDTAHPMFRHIKELSALRTQHPALADGAQIHRYASGGPGVYAFSRIDAQEQVEYLVATNNSETAQTVELQTFNRKTMYRQLWPASKDRQLSDESGRITVTVPPLSAVVLRANDRLAPDRDSTPSPSFTAPAAGVVGGRAEIGAVVPGNEFRQVTFAYREVGQSAWTVLGTDDNAPYRVFHDVRALPAGTPLEYRVIARDADGDLGVDNLAAVVGTPPAPARVGGSVTRVPQPPAVSVPGSHNSEMGCAAGDWQPDCAQAQLALDPADGIWKGSYVLPAGGYEYKAAISRSWDENYGQGAARNGSNINYSLPSEQTVRFFYDHRTNWVNSSAQGPVLTAVGDFQSEVGCTAGDDQPTCMSSWLQDPDGDGTSVFRTAEIPAGTWTVQVARDGVLTGEPTSFTVPADGVVTRFSAGENGLTVSFEKQSEVPDLASTRAQWVQPDTVVLDVADDRLGFTYRLHHGPAGSLVLDQEGVGGASLPLTLDPASPADAERLVLPLKDVKDAFALARSGQLAVVVYDAGGQVVDATGVAVGSWAKARVKPGKGRQ
jgi:glycosidase